MNNTNFETYYTNSGETLYSISHATGIPYTTLSELKNNKLDINRCAYNTVVRLAAYWGCLPGELVNPTQLMKNVSGKYRGVSYRWTATENDSELHILDEDKDVILQKSSDLTQPRFYKAYNAIAMCLIDIYLEQKESEEMLCRSTF